MRAELTRDSVAMGDDADAPHAEGREFREDLTIRQAIASVVADHYLAGIHGGRATWIAQADDGTALAVVAQQWAEPRMLVAGELPLARFADADGRVRLHFAYRRQLDPEAEYARLAAGPPR
ncbi:hypothetical protein ACGFZP_36160 [Kitasatospora sp. NPDC048239]|uniref:hypothetical protein n=1 Tax=Kitasatospora sp. NPDC048239 TaxID=3364046 RepID=UPI003712444E